MAAVGAATRFTRARLADAAGRAAAEGAFFNELPLGSTVALLYEDDPGVWHEALVTGGCPVVPEGGFYRFRRLGPVQRVIVRGKPDAEEAAEAAGIAAPGGAAVVEAEVPEDSLRARAAAARVSVWVLCDPTDPGFGSAIASSAVQHRSGKAGLTDKGLYVKHMTLLEVSGLRERLLDALEAGGAAPRGSAASASAGGGRGDGLDGGKGDGENGGRGRGARPRQ